MALKEVVDVHTLLQGDLFRHCNRWCITFCTNLGTHALVNFVDEDLSAIVPTKRLWKGMPKVIQETSWMSCGQIKICTKLP